MEDAYFGSKEANQRRYEEIRADIEKIKARHTRTSTRFTTDEEILAEINKGGKKNKRGHRDAAYARKVEKRKLKRRRR